MERFFESLKYEHLYREEITNGVELAVQTERFVDLYNRIRPHEHLDWRRPLDVFTQPASTPATGCRAMDQGKPTPAIR